MFVLRTAFLRDPKRGTFRILARSFSALRRCGRRAPRCGNASAVLGIGPSRATITCTLLLGDQSVEYDAVVLACRRAKTERILGDPRARASSIWPPTIPIPIVDVHCWHDGGKIGIDLRRRWSRRYNGSLRNQPGLSVLQFQRRQEYRAPTAELEALAWREVQTFLPQLRDARFAGRGNAKSRSDLAAEGRVAAHAKRTQPSSHCDRRFLDRHGLARHDGIGGAQRQRRGGRMARAAGTPKASRRCALRRPSWIESRRDASFQRAVGLAASGTITEGWWSGELETNVTMTAEHVLLFRFLGLSHDEFRDGAIGHILRHQRSDGSWALYYDGPADFSTTIEAYVALKVLGVDPQSEEMRKALRRYSASREASLNARVFTKIWLALFGVYPWSGVPSLPPEIVFFPLWMPFNLYDFACWARGTVAPLTIVVSKRPVRPSASTSTRSSRPAPRRKCVACADGAIG